MMMSVLITLLVLTEQSDEPAVVKAPSQDKSSTEAIELLRRAIHSTNSVESFSVTLDYAPSSLGPQTHNGAALTSYSIAVSGSNKFGMTWLWRGDPQTTVTFDGTRKTFYTHSSNQYLTTPEDQLKNGPPPGGQRGQEAESDLLPHLPIGRESSLGVLLSDMLTRNKKPGAKSLCDQARAITHLGSLEHRGQSCERVRAKCEDGALDILVSLGDLPLIHEIVFRPWKDKSGSEVPAMLGPHENKRTITLHNWAFGKDVSTELLEFRPPPDAKRIVPPPEVLGPPQRDKPKDSENRDSAG